MPPDGSTAFSPAAAAGLHGPIISPGGAADVPGWAHCLQQQLLLALHGPIIPLRNAVDSPWIGPMHFQQLLRLASHGPILL